MAGIRLNSLRPRLLLGLLLCPAAACSSYPTLTEVADEINATYYDFERLVGVGDLLDVHFPYSADWDHETRVRDDGVASFLFLDDVPAAGRTLRQLDDELTSRYAEALQLQRPELTILLKEEGPHSVTVQGEVQRPGSVKFEGGRLTLIEAVGLAGGFNKSSAKLSSLLLVRRLTDATIKSWRIDARVQYWETADPVFLQPGDLVYIPNTGIDRANIWVDQWIRRMIPLPIPPVGS